MWVVEPHEIREDEAIEHPFIVHVVSNHENSFLRGMSVEVAKEEGLVLLVEVHK